MDNVMTSVLLAEDSFVNQRLITQILRRKGCRVEAANNGQAALEACRTNSKTPPFDLVLMDIEMPLLDGLEATKRIRTLPHCKTMPIIALTGHQGESDDELKPFFDAGMDGLLTKPINLAKLHQTINRYCTGPSSTTVQSESECPEKTLSIKSTDFDPIITDAARQLIDMSGLQQRVGGRLDFALHIMQIFFKGTDELETQLLVAINRMDRDEIRRLAHRIKGSMGNVGFLAGHDAIAAMEKGAAYLPQAEMQDRFFEWKTGIDAIRAEFSIMAEAFMAQREKVKKKTAR